MSIINRQIGWSNESNLLWYILREMDRLVKVTSKSDCCCPTDIRPCYVELLFDGGSPITSLSDANNFFSTIDGTSQFFTGFVPLFDSNSIAYGCRLYGGKNLLITSAGFTTFGTNIVSVDDPCGVFTQIEEGAFINVGVYYVNLPGIITIDQNQIFKLCGNLSVVNLPNLTHINANDTFSSCGVLSSISLPNLLEINGNDTFNGTPLNASINFPKLASITGNNNFKQTSIYGPICTFPKLTTITGDANFDTYNIGIISNTTFPELQFIIGNSNFSKDGYYSEVHMPKLELIQGDSNFYLQSPSVTVFDFPKLQSVIGFYNFQGNNPITTINIPVCTQMGSNDCSINQDNFIAIVGQTITLTLPASLMTCNSSYPDVDIANLLFLNTVTVITT